MRLEVKVDAQQITFDREEVERSGEPTMRPRSSVTPAFEHAASRTFTPSAFRAKNMCIGCAPVSFGNITPRHRSRCPEYSQTSDALAATDRGMRRSIASSAAAGGGASGAAVAPLPEWWLRMPIARRASVHPPKFLNFHTSAEVGKTSALGASTWCVFVTAYRRQIGVYAAREMARHRLVRIPYIGIPHAALGRRTRRGDPGLGGGGYREHAIGAEAADLARHQALVGLSLNFQAA